MEDLQLLLEQYNEGLITEQDLWMQAVTLGLQSFKPEPLPTEPAKLAERLFDLSPSNSIVLRDGDFLAVLSTEEKVVKLRVAVCGTDGYKLLADEVMYAQPNYTLGVRDYRWFLTRAEEIISQHASHENGREAISDQDIVDLPGEIHEGPPYDAATATGMYDRNEG